MSKGVWLALLAPPGLVAVVFAVSGFAALIYDRPLIWPASPINLSEAMAMRDQAEVARQVELGMDLNQTYVVRDAIRSGADIAVTPLEAAIATREGYMFALGLAYGARLDSSNAARLHCLALAHNAVEITPLLTDRVGPPPDCSDVDLPWN